MADGRLGGAFLDVRMYQTIRGFLRGIVEGFLTRGCQLQESMPTKNYPPVFK
jgi:hypothetical protein